MYYQYYILPSIFHITHITTHYCLTISEYITLKMFKKYIGNNILDLIK